MEDRLVRLAVPQDYSFEHALGYLQRNESECLHQVEDRTVYKALRIGNETALLAIEEGNGSLTLRFLNGSPSAALQEEAVSFVREWLDLDSRLEDFYALSARDPVLQPVAEQYRGLRLVGVPSLLEALCWTVIGQQINLSFAYTLKKRLVETFGDSLVHQGRQYMLFPGADRLAAVSREELQALKFSRFKAETLLAVARLIAEKELSKEQLLQMGDFRLAEERLMEVRGIGPWTAQYASMRCLRNPDAFPLTDVGLHHAIRMRLGQTAKPSLPQVEAMGRAWQPWRAYATFYLWRTLY
ncbi:DNA-3-methyladenine glycosylase [Paenibacillus sp. YN15]|uniref:DNA-3-methyladenine glycosylase family protein n=1 Tax=Paenibacillus sp. YN15 TaxID=1742774 RepID=UPI000DCBED35|nr:DNA-3-methyladenine glycosylase [Paenibacillus sp. YN15]RAU99603.1 DNA-3-methyladenine glycosylase [Paenibacillus sp. YN15]